ncbi:hypothetical protein TDB9533_04647 [Thalassocella blandensis]|nr:hypothetical protein TDB9533_04647 [Thalassocella blandensis]
MLANYLKTGTKILGLAQLINSGKPGFAGCYRVVPVGTVMAIEFFDAGKRSDQNGMKNIGILPYRPSEIAELSLVHHQEVISGEFTGCIMSLYRKQSVLTAAHVDTNPETSKRMAYENQKNNNIISPIAECDTTGMLSIPKTVILCIATKEEVKSYVVEKGTHSSHKKVPVPGMPGQFQTGQVGETIYTVK